MALDNVQYDAVMRRYDEIRARKARERDLRREEVLVRLPELGVYEAQVAEESLNAARRRISDPGADLADYSAAIGELAHKREALLTGAGYPADYLELQYECPVCRDTGYVDGRRCSCFGRIAADILYGRSGLGEILKKENFAHFSFNWYSDTIKDEATGLSAYEHARAGYDAARDVAQNPRGEDQNLFIYGTTGVGKTFLTHCIAAEILEAGGSVLYFSSGELFDLLADAAFGRKTDVPDGHRLITACDLLVIDDLGTELTNAFVASELFRIISERGRNGRSTVISTNLSLQKIRERYSERVFSRITCHYKIIKLIGEDIRIHRKLSIDDRQPHTSERS